MTPDEPVTIVPSPEGGFMAYSDQHRIAVIGETREAALVSFTDGVHDLITYEREHGNEKHADELCDSRRRSHRPGSVRLDGPRGQAAMSVLPAGVDFSKIPDGEPCPICGPAGHGGHEDDSYGDCVRCYEYVPHTDAEFRKVAWPCAVYREKHLAYS